MPQGKGLGVALDFFLELVKKPASLQKHQGLAKYCVLLYDFLHLRRKE